MVTKKISKSRNKNEFNFYMEVLKNMNKDLEIEYEKINNNYVMLRSGNKDSVDETNTEENTN